MNKRYSPKQIAAARTVDIAAYLENKGEIVKFDGKYDVSYKDAKSGATIFKKGKQFKHSEHDSLVIRGDNFIWNSRSIHGDAINLVREFYGLSFSEAVADLLDFRGSSGQENISRQEFSYVLKGETPIFDDSETDYWQSDDKRVWAYLTKTRGIDGRIVSNLMSTGLICGRGDESHSIVFPFYNEYGEIVGGHWHTSNSFYKTKRNIRNSERGYGYTVYSCGLDLRGTGLLKANRRSAINKCIVFEAPIDLISFVEINLKGGLMPLNTLLLAMCGLKPTIIMNTIKAFNVRISADNPLILSLDNDKAAQEFVKNFSNRDIPFKTWLLKSEYKDWNDQLRESKKPQVTAKEAIHAPIF